MSSGTIEDAATFHTHGSGIVYRKALGRVIAKQAEHMARVKYDEVHRNVAYQDERRGRGVLVATWVVSEEPGLAEGQLESGLELVIDAVLEPHGAIGLHTHTRTEEVYYLLEGALTMWTHEGESAPMRFDMKPGDAHVVRIGQAHHGVASEAGARFIAVAVRR
jgi:mannose-6-phosphate isomerase-like protein (cupin superfamily)